MHRSLVFALVLLLLFVSGCGSITSVQSVQLTGSGKITTQDFSLDKADRLLAASNFKMKFTTGDKVSVTVHADDNVMEHVYVHVSNGELRLEMKPGHGYSMTNVTLRAEVTMPAPSAITLKENATLDISQIRASEMSVRLEGNSIITGKEVSIPRLSLTSEGNGMVQLGGSAAELTVEGSGNTQFACPNLQVHTAKIDLKNNGMAALHVTDKLDYNVSGNAGIVYTGSPQLGEQTRRENAFVQQK